MRELDYPFHQEPFGPDVDYGFNPTPPEQGSEGTADFEVGGEGSLSAEDRDTLIDLFDDQLFNDDQFQVDGDQRSHTPRHIWLWLNEEVFTYLHFNEENPEVATELDYFGIGVRGQFDGESRPNAEDFTHFHKHEAESWGAGHGAQSSEQYGYWLVHHAVREIQYPFHEEPIGVGVDREFMPTPLE